MGLDRIPAISVRIGVAPAERNPVFWHPASSARSIARRGRRPGALCCPTHAYDPEGVRVGTGLLGSSAAMLDSSARACALGVSGSAWYTVSSCPGAPLTAKE